MQRAGRLRPWVLCVFWVAALVILASACGGPERSAAVRFEGRAATAYPPKPPKKPLAAATARGGSGRVVTVVRGDTVYGISRRHGVPIRTIIEANRLRPPYVLQVGQTLVLDARRYHTVKPGETLYAISRLYEVDMRSLAHANRLGPPYTIEVGRRLSLPGAVAGAPPAVASARAAPRAAPASPSAGDAPRQAPEPSVAAIERGTVPQPPRRAARLFEWPAEGRIISAFGPKPGGLHNDGVNIAAERGTPVRAAANGIVVYVGNELRGFGNLVLLRHDGGWTTAYAHNEAINVRRGQTVERGQVIARLGSSGHVTEPQLHFEVRKGAEAVDPQSVLGPAPAAAVSRAGRRVVRRDPE